MRLPLRATTAATCLLVGTLTACAGGPDVGGDVDAPPPSAATTCAEQVLADLDQEQRIGQLFVVGVPIRQNRDAATWLADHHVGGVLMTGSISTSAAPAAKAVARMLDASPGDPDPFVAVTQVGGDDTTLQGRFGDLPDVATQREWDVAELGERWTDTADALHRAGITLTFSPVADTAVDDDSISADLTYGDDPADVAPWVDTVVRSLESQGVAAALSAFPGQGRVTDDPRRDAEVSDDELTIDDPQIAPFVTGIEAGADLIQVSAATFGEIDGEQPATYSRAVVTDLLRGIANFQGVVVSADLSGGDSIETLPVDERAAAFVGAGGDLVLSTDTDAAEALIDGLAAAVAGSTDLADQVDAAALRVLTAKAERGIVSCG